MRCLLALLFALLAMPAGAAELYRCTEKGRTIYQDTPCKNGRVIDTDAREALRGYDSQVNDGRAGVPARGAPETVPAPYVAPVAPPRATAPPVNPNAAECAALGKEEQSLREQARQPNTTTQQDSLRERLRKAQERMYERRCE